VYWTKDVRRYEICWRHTLWVVVLERKKKSIRTTVIPKQSTTVWKSWRVWSLQNTFHIFHKKILHFWCHDCKKHTISRPPPANTAPATNEQVTASHRSRQVQYGKREMRCRMGRQDMLALWVHRDRSATRISQWQRCDTYCKALSLCFPHKRVKENVLFFGKSKPNCHSKVLLCLVVHWIGECGVPHWARSVRIDLRVTSIFDAKSSWSRCMRASGWPPV
jgi:hypothetical protein